MPGLSGHPFINNRLSAEKMMAASSPESALIRERCYGREEQLSLNLEMCCFIQ